MSGYECPICRSSDFQSDKHIPVILRCGHTFGKECLQSMKTYDIGAAIPGFQRGAQCPNCKATIGHISHLIINYALIADGAPKSIDSYQFKEVMCEKHPDMEIVESIECPDFITVTFRCVRCPEPKTALNYRVIKTNIFELKIKFKNIISQFK